MTDFVEIDLPDGSVGEFPRSMTDDQILAVLRKQYPSTKATAAPAPESEGGFSALARNIVPAPAIEAAGIIERGLAAGGRAAAQPWDRPLGLSDADRRQLMEAGLMNRPAAERSTLDKTLTIPRAITGGVAEAATYGINTLFRTVESAAKGVAAGTANIATDSGIAGAVQEGARSLYTALGLENHAPPEFSTEQNRKKLTQDLGVFIDMALTATMIQAPTPKIPAAAGARNVRRIDENMSRKIDEIVSSPAIRDEAKPAVRAELERRAADPFQVIEDVIKRKPEEAKPLEPKPLESLELKRVEESPVLGLKERVAGDGLAAPLKTEAPRPPATVAQIQKVVQEFAESPGRSPEALAKIETLLRDAVERRDTPVLDLTKRAEETKPQLMELHGGLGMIDPRPLMDAYTKFVSRGLERLGGTWVGRRVQRLGPLGDIPKDAKREYLIARYQSMGADARITKSIDTLSKKMRATFDGPTGAKVYEFLTTKGADPAIIQNAAARALAVKTKSAIEAVGREKLARGLISKETFDKYQGEYLPRKYLATMYDVPHAEVAGGFKADLKHLIQRKDIPDYVRDIIMGEIKDPAYLASRALMIPARDFVRLDFADKIAGMKDITLPSAQMNYHGKMMDVAFVQRNVDQMKAQLPAIKDPAQLAAVKAEIAATEARIVEAGHELPKNVNMKDYRRVPDVPRYGNLAGRFIRKEVYNDLMGSIDLALNPNAMTGFYNGAKQAMRGWKLAHVGLNPPTQFRNFMSNMMQINLEGVDIHMILPRVTQAFREMTTDGKHWKIAKDYGVDQVSFASTEMIRFDRELRSLVNNKSGPFEKMWAMGKSLSEASGKIHGFTEGLFKTAMIIDRMKKGDSAADAALAAHRAIFDYTLVTPSVREIRSVPLGSPFVTFTTKVIPRLAEIAVKQPWRYLPYILLGEWINSEVQKEYGASPEEMKKVYNSLNDFLKDKTLAMPIPLRDEHGRFQVLDFSYLTPFGQIVDFVDNMQKGDVTKAATGLFGSPGLDAIAAFLTKVDPFTQREIFPKGSSPAEQVSALLNYAWSRAMPPWITDRGAAMHMLRTAQGDVHSKTGEPLLTETQAALRFFGLNVYPQRPEQTRQANIKKLERELNDAKSHRTTMIRDRNLSTPEQRQSVIEEQNENVKRMQDKLNTYRRESGVPSGWR